MRVRLSSIGILALASLAAAPFAGAGSVVIVADHGGFSPETIRTVRSLVVTELGLRGIDVGETTGARDREFVLRLGRLDQKVLITLEDVVPPKTTPRRSRRASRVQTWSSLPRVRAAEPEPAPAGSSPWDFSCSPRSSSR